MLFGDGVIGFAVEDGGVIHQCIDCAQSLDKLRNACNMAQVVINPLADNFFTELPVKRKNPATRTGESARGSKADTAPRTGDKNGS